MRFFRWYFFRMPRVIFKVWTEILAFIVYFFGFFFHLRHFFSPWRKMILQKNRGFVLREFFNVLSFNLISRIIGAFLRFLLIVWGGSALLFVFFSGLLILIIWILLPFAVLWGAVFAIKLLTL